ncbi:MAG: carbohydrate-binding protein [Nonlabens sp.]
MKNLYTNLKICGVAGVAALLLIGCERDLSDDAVEALFPSTPDIYVDDPVNLTDEFFESFDPNGGANPDGFNTTTEESYEGSSSIQISVPAPDDPNGGFIGGIFRDRGDGRNLTDYDALTFWAKGSTTANIDEVGFGVDFDRDFNPFAVSRTGLRLSTAWRKYVVPIPDPSVLTQERGLFVFSTGTMSSGGVGFDFFIDNLRFEKLGTIAQPRPSIFQGEDVFQQGFIGSQFEVTSLQETFNTVTNGDVTVNVAPGYFTFTSSDPSVAVVDENGLVEIVGASPMDMNGDPIPTIITAALKTGEDEELLEADGSLSVNSIGQFNSAPVPDRDQENVISIFSDAYNNVPVDYYNGFFNGDGQTTEGGAPPLNIAGDQVINYTRLNFVGIGSFLNVQPINASSMTHLHVDINVQEVMQGSDFIRLQLLNGVQTGNETAGSFTLRASDLTTDDWEGFDIPLSNFSGLGGRDQIGLLFFISDNTISNILVDNIYFYREVVDPTPIVDDSGNTQVVLPIGFESTTLNYNINPFEGAENEIITNPDQSGINTSSRVLRTIKPAGSAFFAGTFIDLEAPIDFSSSQVMRMKVWSPKANIPVRMALETAGGGNQIFVDVNVPVANEWVELEFNFSALFNPGLSYQRVVFINEFIDGTPGDGSTYYADDIRVLD